MDKRVALIGIIIEKYESAESVNSVLHEYGAFIIGRMGIPYRERALSIISVVIDAPQDVISAISGKLGMIDGVHTKTIYSKTSKEEKS